MAGFPLEHSLLRAARTAAFLSSDLLGSRPLGGHKTSALFLDAVEEKAASEEAVEGLGARFFTADADPRGAMEECHGGGGLVDLLAAGSAGTHEEFLDLFITDPEGPHAKAKDFLLLGGDGKGMHYLSYASK